MDFPDQYDIRLPVAAVPELCSEDARKFICMICVPMHSAKEGDVVAIVQDTKSMNHGMSLFGITQFIAATGDPDKPYRRVNFTELDPEHQAQVALGAMHFQSRGLHVDKLWHAVDPLENGDGEPSYIEVFVTADFAIAAVENYYDEIFAGTFHGEELDQDVISSAFLGLLYEDITSAHDVVETLSLSQEMVDLVNSILPVSDPIDEDVVIPLKAPDFSEI